MKRYLRQFAESATGYVPKLADSESPIVGIRLSLAFLYIVVVIAMVCMAFYPAHIVSLAVTLVMAIAGIIVSQLALARFDQSVVKYARLISDVSHDLRNSLAVMKMTSEVELLRGAEMTPEDSRRFIEGKLHELDEASRVLGRHLSDRKTPRLNSIHQTTPHPTLSSQN